MCVQNGFYFPSQTCTFKKLDSLTSLQARVKFITIITVIVIIQLQFQIFIKYETLDMVSTARRKTKCN